jgi:hypothetical protein
MPTLILAQVGPEVCGTVLRVEPQSILIARLNAHELAQHWCGEAAGRVQCPCLVYDQPLSCQTPHSTHRQSQTASCFRSDQPPIDTLLCCPELVLVTSILCSKRIGKVLNNRYRLLDPERSIAGCDSAAIGPSDVGQRAV